MAQDTTVSRMHTPNLAYPDQKFGDFSDDYDPETSDHPWNLDGNCAQCGRIEVPPPLLTKTKLSSIFFL